jgi:hypothetical protein
MKNQGGGAPWRQDHAALRRTNDPAAAANEPCQIPNFAGFLQVESAGLIQLDSPTVLVL